MLLAISVTSCGLGRMVKVDEHAYGGSYVEAKATVTEIVDKCWTLRSENTFKRDHVFGIIEEEDMQYSIVIGRHNFDIPFAPFARIIVHNVSEGVIIDVEEKEMSLSTPNDVAGNVSNWLSGDTTCQPLESR